MIDRAAFERDGAARLDGLLSPDDIERLRQIADSDLTGRPGVRLSAKGWLADFLARGAPQRLATALTSDAARPVRAVMLDKSPEANWSVAWHQDRTIAVAEQIETEGFGPWSLKDGALHVAPPFEVLAGMVTLRLHLDGVDEDNAPLRVALGSHRLGRVAAGDAATQAGLCEQSIGLARAGDVWAYRTPILHALDRSHGRRRRVLQVDYADFDLQGGLEWSGAC